MGVESKLHIGGCADSGSDDVGKCHWAGDGPFCRYDCYFDKAHKRLCAFKDQVDCGQEYGNDSATCRSMAGFVGCVKGCYVLYCPDWK